MLLSVLDQSPVSSGSSAADAIRQTVELARLVERLGYHRVWLAEHHGAAGLAGSAPEVLAAAVAAATTTLRVGSGGVLLSHYSALKVAEAFRVLEALYPGRIDLGVGRAPGATELAGAALRSGPEAFGDEHFSRRLAELVGFVTGALPPDHPFAGVAAVPAGPTAPEVWLLGSSSDSADRAAALGLPLCFGHFITPTYGPQVVARYRQRFRPSARLDRPLATVAVSVVCADTDGDADRLALPGRVWRLDPQPLRRQVPSAEEAAGLDLTPLEAARLDQGREKAIVGGPERVRSRLLGLAAEFDVDELLVVTVCHGTEAKVRSYGLLAEAFGLSPPSARLSNVIEE